MSDTLWFLRTSWGFMRGQRLKFFLGLPKAYKKFMTSIALDRKIASEIQMSSD